MLGAADLGIWKSKLGAKSFQESWKKTLGEGEPWAVNGDKVLHTAKSDRSHRALRLQKFSSGKDMACEMELQTWFQATLSLLIPEQRQAQRKASAQMRKSE